MWEFGMDGGRYDVTEFRNRHLTLPALDDDSIQPESLLSRTASQINATTKCISAAHSILDCFRSIPTERLQKAPNVIFVRAVYALVALMKAEYAVGTDKELSEMLDSQSLKADYYLNIVMKKTEEAIGPQKCRIPSHWKFVLEAKLKTWWDEYQDWRKEGRHLKRRKTGNEREGASTGNQTPMFTDAKGQQPLGATNTMVLTNNQGMQAIFPAGNPSSFPQWNGNDIQVDPAGSVQQSGDQTGFPNDAGDFSAAFQNGDLYLWNDMTADSFGGWIPQSGLYSGIEFGALNGQGF